MSPCRSSDQTLANSYPYKGTRKSSAVRPAALARALPTTVVLQARRSHRKARKQRQRRQRCNSSGPNPTSRPPPQSPRLLRLGPRRSRRREWILRHGRGGPPVVQVASDPCYLVFLAGNDGVDILLFGPCRWDRRASASQSAAMPRLRLCGVSEVRRPACSIHRQRTRRCGPTCGRVAFNHRSAPKPHHGSALVRGPALLSAWVFLSAKAVGVCARAQVALAKCGIDRCGPQLAGRSPRG